MKAANPVYTIKSVKTFIGMEGQGYNATLCRDGKPVALVIDDASGGPMMYEWKDADKDRVDVNTLSWDDKPVVVKMTPEEKILTEFVAAMPATVCDFIDPNTKAPAVLRTTNDLYVDELVNDAALLKQIKRWTKKEVAVVDGRDVVTFKCEANEKNYSIIRGKRPNCIILNALSDAEMVAVVKKATK